MPSASLVPAAARSVGAAHHRGHAPAQAVLPRSRAAAAPPARHAARSASARADIDIVGSTARHNTFFEMLGNFSIGDYFKAGAIEFALELSLKGFGLDFDRIWVTVFEGDEELGLGPDEEAIEAWVAAGFPRERIVACDREENFWQAGPTGPCGPCSELYYDRGARATARRTTSRARRTSASSSTGTSSSCSSTRTRSTRSRRCRRRTSTPGSGSPGWRRSSRTSARSTRPTSSGR